MTILEDGNLVAVLDPLKENVEKGRLGVRMPGTNVPKVQQGVRPRRIVVLRVRPDILVDRPIGLSLERTTKKFNSFSERPRCGKVFVTLSVGGAS